MLNCFACCIKYHLLNSQMACSLFRSVRGKRMDDERGSNTSSLSVFLDGFEFEFDFDFLDDVQGLSQWELLNSSDADSDSLRNGDLPVMFEPASFEDIWNSLNGFPVENNSADRDHGVANDEYDDEDYDEDDGYEFDLDDELIPWSVGSVLQRQRMRKSGKNGFPNRRSSKKPPRLFMRPGCIRGKHGLGLKHYL